MQIEFILFAFGVLLIVYFAWLMPSRLSLSTIAPVLEVLWQFGRDRTVHRCKHKKSGKELVFELRVVGGIKQLHLHIPPLGLNEFEHSTLKDWFSRHTSETDGVSVGSRTVNFGTSLPAAIKLTRQFGLNFLNWSENERLKLYMDPVDLSLKVPKHLLKTKR